MKLRATPPLIAVGERADPVRSRLEPNKSRLDLKLQLVQPHFLVGVRTRQIAGAAGRSHRCEACRRVGRPGTPKMSPARLLTDDPKTGYRNFSSPTIIGLLGWRTFTESLRPTGSGYAFEGA